jgi:uncharacterized alkaline shock family protein YloU
MTEIQTNSSNIGQIQIADEVIAVIAGTAALEIDGVVGMASNFTGDLAEIMGKRNLSKGVKISVNEDSVSVEINLIIAFGYKIQDVSVEVQKKVKTAIETMTGLPSNEININIAGIHMDKTPKQKDER